MYVSLLVGEHCEKCSAGDDRDPRQLGLDSSGLAPMWKSRELGTPLRSLRQEQVIIVAARARWPFVARGNMINHGRHQSWVHAALGVVPERRMSAFTV